MPIFLSDWRPTNVANGARVQFRVVLDWGSVTSTSTTVTATAQFQVRFNKLPGIGGSFDSRLRIRMDNLSGGRWGPDLPFTDSTEPHTTFTNVRTVTFTYHYASGSYGTSPGTTDLEYQFSTDFVPAGFGGDYGAKPGIPRFSIPARPYAFPTAPSSFDADRDSDSRAFLSWVRNPTTAAPYRAQAIEYRNYVGTTWSGFTGGKVPGATATSYVFTGLTGNRAYQFRIRAISPRGASSWVTSPIIYMTPAAPFSVAARMNASATAATITWKPLTYQMPGVTHVVERSVNGGSWTQVASGLASNATGWTDSDITEGATHAWRVKAMIGSLSSIYAETKTLLAPIAPLAPAIIRPASGAVVDFGADLEIAWLHTDGGDGAGQSHYNVRLEDVGQSVTVRPDIASSAESWILPGGTFLPSDPGEPVIINIRTEGVVSAGYSPEATRTVIGSTRPVVTITDWPAVIDSLPASVSFTFADYDAGTVPVAIQVRLMSPDLVTEYAAYALEGSAQDIDGFWTTQLTHPMTTGDTFVVVIAAQDDLGLWSDEVISATATVDLPPAASAQITEGTWEPDVAAINLTIVPDPPVLDVTGTASTCDLQRRIDPDGESEEGWITIATGLPLLEFTDGITLPDRTCSINGVNEYRLVVTSDAGVVATMTATLQVVATETRRGWLSSGPGDAWSTQLAITTAPRLSGDRSRAKTLHRFAGRKRPVEFAGEQLAESVQVAGVITSDDDTLTAWEALGETSGVVLWRDPTGRRIFGSVGGMSHSQNHPELTSISFTVTAVDHSG